MEHSLVRKEWTPQLKKQRLLYAERRYPMVVAGRVVNVPYSIAVKKSTYRPMCSCKLEYTERSSWLCSICRDGIRGYLLDIEASWSTLEMMLLPSASAQGEKVDTSRTGSPAPMDVAVSDIMHVVRDRIWGIVNQLRQDKPAVELPPDISTGSLAGWMGRWHVQYIATHPEDSLADMAGPELADAVKLIRTRVDPSGTRHIPVKGTCTKYTTDDRGRRVPCNGQLYAVLRSSDSDRASWVRCPEDSTHDMKHIEWLGLLKSKQRKEAKA